MTEECEGQSPGRPHPSAETGARATVGEWWRIARSAYIRMDADDGFPLAGNIAFSITLSAFPFLILLTSLAGFLGDAEFAVDAVRLLLDIAPREVVDPLRTEIVSILTTKRQGVLTISIIVTIWTASGGIKSVRTGLNRAYGLVDTRPFWLLRLQDVVFVILGVFGLLMLGGLLILGPLVWRLLEPALPLPGGVSNAFHLLRFPAFMLCAAGILFVAHKWLPARRMRTRSLLPGIVITLVIWTIGGWAYGVYVANFSNYANTYAGLAGVAIALIILNLSGVVLLFGAEVNQVLALRRAASDAAGD